MRKEYEDILVPGNLVLSSVNNFVGVGWAYLDKTWDYIHPQEDGIKTNGFIHSRRNHQQAWPSTVVNREPGLRHLHYTSLPRYRVLFRKHPIVIGLPTLLACVKFRAHLTQLYCLDSNTDWDETSVDNSDHYTGSEMGPDPLFAIKTVAYWR